MDEAVGDDREPPPQVAGQFDFSVTVTDALGLSSTSVYSAAAATS
jgi:hypothetical protein